MVAKDKPREKKSAPKVVRKSAKELRLERFIAEYLIDYKGTRAAIAAGFAPESARVRAAELLSRPEVQARVQERQAELLDQLQDMEKFVLSKFMGVAAADARELVELHKVACRYCWGKDNRYQRTPAERELDYKKWLADERNAQALDPAHMPSKFDEQGGLGYTTKKDPNPNCPECFGDGVSKTVMGDSRDFSEQASQLYAGVEETQHGIRVRMHSKMDAALNLGKHFGMFSTKVKLAPTDRDDEAKQLGVLGDILDLVNASDTGTGPAKSRRGD